MIMFLLIIIWHGNFVPVSVFVVGKGLLGLVLVGPIIPGTNTSLQVYRPRAYGYRYRAYRIQRTDTATRPHRQAPPCRA